MWSRRAKAKVATESSDDDCDMGTVEGVSVMPFPNIYTPIDSDCWFGKCMFVTSWCNPEFYWLPKSI